MHHSLRGIIDFFIVFVILFALLFGFLLDSTLKTVDYNASSVEIPDSFNGFKIAQITDLHSSECGENNEKLITMLGESAPDIIVFTGDMIDAKDTDASIMLHLAEEAVKIAPCYYSPGNHESSNKALYSTLCDSLRELGVNILENEAVTITVGEESITLIGILDPAFDKNSGDSKNAEITRDFLKDLVPEDSYTVLLAHRPELINVYAEAGVDLVLSGHTHGGQIRIPILGGLYANDQGFLPPYDKGLFTQSGTTMIVSSGIGDSNFPMRYYNPREITLIKLSTVK